MHPVAHFLILEDYWKCKLTFLNLYANGPKKSVRTIFFFSKV